MLQGPSLPSGSGSRSGSTCTGDLKVETKSMPWTRIKDWLGGRGGEGLIQLISRRGEGGRLSDFLTSFSIFSTHQLRFLGAYLYMHLLSPQISACICSYRAGRWSDTEKSGQFMRPCVPSVLVLMFLA